MIGGIIYGVNVKRTKSLFKASKEVVHVKRQENERKRRNIWKQNVINNFIFLSILIFATFALGMFIGYNNGVSYASHHLLYRDLLNHIQPEVRESFLASDYTNICPKNTYFVFKECSTNFGLYSSEDLCFVCEGGATKLVDTTGKGVEER